MIFTILAAVVGLIAALLLLGWLGLTVKPKPFSSFPEKGASLESIPTIPLPKELPAPVERFYRKVYGERVPVIHSAVMTGRAEMRPFGVTLPGRFRFTHDAGKGYRHYIEATWFGLPFMKVNERYLDGKSLFEFPTGTQEGPKLSQAANLGMWAELLSTPSVLLTDSRVRWEAVDNNTALLVVPFEQAEEIFVVRFDPETDLVDFTEVMRYRDENSKTKSLWITKVISPKVGSAMWYEDGKPWAVFTTEDIALNVNVSESIRSRGE
jgi:hypothetical protein